MRRTNALAVAVVVASLLAVPIVGAAATGGAAVAQTDNGTDGTNETNATVSPGERLSGVVGVQGAELEGEVETRAFGIQVARAASDNATAAIVRERLADLENRTTELEQRKEQLQAARENGSMSEGEYRARVSEMVARGQTVKDLANRTNETASSLPREVLEANGVNVTAIQTLRNNAGNLTGPEVAEIARSIAGPGVARQGPSAGPPSEVGGDGPRGQAGNATAGPDGRDGNMTGGQDGNMTDGRDGNTTDGNTTGTDTRDGDTRGADTRGGN